MIDLDPMLRVLEPNMNFLIHLALKLRDLFIGKRKKKYFIIFHLATLLNQDKPNRKVNKGGTGLERGFTHVIEYRVK